MCEKNGDRLDSPQEGLLRQVGPSWLDEDGIPSSQAFYPWRTIDDGCLSVDRSSITSPETSYHLATGEPPAGFGLESVGVWGLRVEEVSALDLSAWSDPVEATAEKPANSAHALVEFGGVAQKKRKSLGRTLKLRALARGRLHPLSQTADAP